MSMAVAIALGVAGAALKVAGAPTSRSAATKIATVNRTEFDLISCLLPSVVLQ
jgi:ABC-type arginine transport system permease subunit